MTETVAESGGRIAPEWRVALFYFVNAMPLGVTVVYAGIWFMSKGIGPDQIGVINALPVLVMMGLNLTIGRIADRASDWRQVIVLGAAFQGGVTLLLFFVNEFWGILAVWTLCIIPNAAIGPVVEAATLRLTKRRGTSFGPIRACATLGYTVTVALTGVLAAQFGGDIFVPLFVGLNLFKALVAQSLPRFRAPEGSKRPEIGAARLMEALKPWFVLPLVGYAMVFGTHIILNAFQALLWKQQGISEALIGPLITLGALSEAAMMFGWKRWGGRLPAHVALLAAALTAAFRWAAFGFSPPLPLLIPLQMLHAITFAMGYLGCVHFIAAHTSERIAAEAQSFFVVIQQAMVVIAVVGFGWLTGFMGAHAYFVASAFALAGAAIIAASARLAGGRQLSQ